jgi:hypothetical protein
MSRHTGEMPGVVPVFRSHSNTGIQQKKAHFVDGGSRAGMSPNEAWLALIRAKKFSREK